LEGEILSQLPPELVLVSAVNEIWPPPTLETVRGRVRADAWVVNGNTTDDWFTLRLGWPAAVTVNETGIATDAGFAVGALMVTTPE
jgi:hypothetical protein